MYVDVLTFLIAAAPFIECRGAIPFGLAHGISPLKVFLLALAGNMLPAILLPITLSLLEPSLLRRYELARKLLNNVRTRAQPHISKYGSLGLALFVAIPLPVSGAWTASLAAFILGLERKKAIISISAGVFIASSIIVLLSLQILELFIV